MPALIGKPSSPSFFMLHNGQSTRTHTGMCDAPPCVALQELDEAARRRMPKQLYIPLPNAEARQSMIERQLGPGSSVQSALSEADMRKIVEKTAGYSGMPSCPCAAA